MRKKHVKVTAKVTLCLTYKDLLLPDEYNKKELSFYARVLSTSPAYIEKLITDVVFERESDMILGSLKDVIVNEFTVRNAYDARK